MHVVKCKNCWRKIKSVKKKHVFFAGFANKKIIFSIFCPHCKKQDLHVMSMLEYKAKGIKIIEEKVIKPKKMEIVIKNRRKND